MCTGLNYVNGDFHLFGRNLDLEIDYPVSAVIMPRNYPIHYRNGETCESHYAMIGVGMVENDYPLYFDAANEKGLGMAGLAFFGMAVYNDPQPDKTNIASFEFIPYILSTCATVDEAKEKLKNINLDNVSFSEGLPNSELHWIIGDKNATIVVEQTKEKGLQVYDNPFGVLTNCPGFDYQLQNVSYYANLTGKVAPIRFADDKTGLWAFSRGLGTIGLPGGTDAISRFVRAAFTKRNSFCDKTDLNKNIAEYFHILSNVQQVNGESEVKPGEYEITQYSSCVDTSAGVLYYSTYYNPALTAVDMKKENLDGADLCAYTFDKTLHVTAQN